MKELACSVCGCVARVSDKATKVTCAECYIVKKRAEEALEKAQELIKRKPQYWKVGMLDKLYYQILNKKKVSHISKNNRQSIWIGAQKLRNEGISLKEIGRVLGVAKSSIWRHTVPFKVNSYAGAKMER